MNIVKQTAARLEEKDITKIERFFVDQVKDIKTTIKKELHNLEGVELNHKGNTDDLEEEIRRCTVDENEAYLGYTIGMSAREYWGKVNACTFRKAELQSKLGLELLNYTQVVSDHEEKMTNLTNKLNKLTGE